MKTIWQSGLFLALFFFSLTPLSAQQDPYICATLSSGIRHCGTLVADDGREITLNTPDKGKVIVPKSDIVSMDEAPEGTTSKAMTDSPDRVYDAVRSAQATRYNYAPSAIPLNKGEGYSHLNPLGFNVTVAPVRNTMAGLSVSWFGLGANLKQSFQLSDKVWTSVGGQATLSWGDYGIGRSTAFANATYGDEQTHITVIGGTSLGGDIDGMTPILGAAVSIAVSDRAWIITENYFGDNPLTDQFNSVFSLGIRRYKLSKNRLTDISAILAERDNGSLIPFIWLGWTWPF